MENYPPVTIATRVKWYHIAENFRGRKTFADFAVLGAIRESFLCEILGAWRFGGWHQANVFELVKITVMSLLKYFQLSNSTLPKADGPLSQVIPSSSITAPDKVVKQVLINPTSQGEKRKCGAYEQFTAALLLAR